MKKLILILLLIQSQIVVSQTTTVSQDSVNIYFQNILNQYRIINNRNGLSIDTTLSPFTKNWSEYMLKQNYCGHGIGDESFINRAIRFEPTALLYCSENVAGPWDFNKDLPLQNDNKFRFREEIRANANLNHNKMVTENRF
jgi:uncharacterized protein YkwD